MVDKELLLRKLSELDEYFKQVKEFEIITVEQYLEDWKLQRIIERTLQMMIEICVDSASHIISDKGYRIPKTYADTFKVLYENGALNRELFGKMEKMTKFRNIVVHNYDKIDAEIVIAILKRDINDFMAYKDAIIKIIKAESDG